MQDPKVSICIVSDDANPYGTAALIDLAHEQSFEPIEVICVMRKRPRKDERREGAADNEPLENRDKVGIETLRKFAENDDTVTIIETEASRWEARLQAIEKARGKYLLFPELGDQLERDMVRRLYHRAEGTQADMVVYGFDIVGHEDIIREKGIHEFALNDSGKDCHVGMLPTLGVGLWNKFYRKSLFDEEFKYLGNPRVQDELLMTANLYARVGKIAFVMDILYHHRRKKRGVSAINSSRGWSQGTTTWQSRDAKARKAPKPQVSKVTSLQDTLRLTYKSYEERGLTSNEWRMMLDVFSAMAVGKELMKYSTPRETVFMVHEFLDEVDKGWRRSPLLAFYSHFLVSKMRALMHACRSRQDKTFKKLLSDPY